MHNSRETASTDALSGGSNRATNLSLNACPHLATSFFRYRSGALDPIAMTTILTQRVSPGFSKRPVVFSQARILPNQGVALHSGANQAKVIF